MSKKKTPTLTSAYSLGHKSAMGRKPGDIVMVPEGYSFALRAAFIAGVNAGMVEAAKAGAAHGR